MRLTFHGHACVRVDAADTRIVIDPGTLADAAQGLRGATAVLITHEHPDHVATADVRAAMESDELLTVRGTPGAVDALIDAGAPADRVHTVEPGENLQIGEAGVRVGGGTHAEIHPRLPRITNCTYTVEVDGVVVHHPGDSFDLPDGDLDVLCLPVSGPWLRLADAIDATLAGRVRAVVPVHDALLSEAGQAAAARLLDTARLGGGHEYRRLASGESFEI